MSALDILTDEQFSTDETRTARAVGAAELVQLRAQLAEYEAVVIAVSRNKTWMKIFYKDDRGVMSICDMAAAVLAKWQVTK